MAYSKEQVQRAKQSVRTGTKLVTPTLDATTTVHIFTLGGCASKASFQGTTGLTGTVEFSVDGVTFGGSAAIATALTSYNTHNFCAIKVTRTGGSGTVSIAAT